MKASAIAGYTTLLLLLALCSFTSSAPVPISVPCCTHYARPLPRSHIKEYYETSSRCPLHAVVFITKRDRHICANPAEQWVQDHVNYLNQN